MFAGTRVDLTFDDACTRADEFGAELIICDALDFVGPAVAATLKVPWAVHGIAGGMPPQFARALPGGTQRSTLVIYPWSTP